MLRDKNLIPLSRQHQHALALCVRINRAAMDTPMEVKAWQEEIQQHFEQEIQYHFAAEEAYLFPAARRYSELSLLVEELLGEHAQLRQYFLKPPRVGSIVLNCGNLQRRFPGTSAEKSDCCLRECKGI